MVNTLDSSSIKKKEQLELEFDRAVIEHQHYIAAKQLRQYYKEKKDKSQFHRTLNAIDSGLIFTQATGDTLSTSSAAIAVAKKTTSLAGHIVLGMGDPFMMFSIGLRSAFGFLRAWVDKEIEARKTRLVTSFLILSLATLAAVMVFGAIAAAPAYSIPLCLLGATFFGYYNDHQVIVEKKRRLEKMERSLQHLKTQIPVLLQQRLQLQLLLNNKKELNILWGEENESNNIRKDGIKKIEEMIETIDTEINDLCQAQHELEANIKLNKGIITCLTRSRNVRLLGAVGITIIIVCLFFFPPLVPAGIGLFILAGIINGIIRKQQYQHEADHHQAIQNKSTVVNIKEKYEKAFKPSTPTPKPLQESEAGIIEELRHHADAKPHPQQIRHHDPHPSLDKITHTLSDNAFYKCPTLVVKKDTNDDKEGEGEHLHFKK